MPFSFAEGSRFNVQNENGNARESINSWAFNQEVGICCDLVICGKMECVSCLTCESTDGMAMQTNMIPIITHFLELADQWKCASSRTV
jgi:hypothetical protein